MKLGELHYNKSTEEGTIRVSVKLPQDVVGLDILKDWIELLTVEYETRIQEVFSRQRKKP